MDNSFEALLAPMPTPEQGVNEVKVGEPAPSETEVSHDEKSEKTEVQPAVDDVKGKTESKEVATKADNKKSKVYHTQEEIDYIIGKTKGKCEKKFAAKEAEYKSQLDDMVSKYQKLKNEYDALKQEKESSTDPDERIAIASEIRKKQNEMKQLSDSYDDSLTKAPKADNSYEEEIRNIHSCLDAATADKYMEEVYPIQDRLDSIITANLGESVVKYMKSSDMAALLYNEFASEKGTNFLQHIKGKMDTYKESTGRDMPASTLARTLGALETYLQNRVDGPVKQEEKQPTNKYKSSFSMASANGTNQVNQPVRRNSIAEEFNRLLGK